MEKIGKSATKQKDVTVEHARMLQEELDSISLGKTLRLKRGYFANYEDWFKHFSSFQNSDLPFNSTDCQYNKYSGTKNSNKCTQENRCDLLNLKPFNSMNDGGKPSGEDVGSENVIANLPETRIHNSSVIRQEIPSVSFSSEKNSKHLNITGQLEAERSNELQSEDPWKIMTPRLNPLLIKQSDQEKPIYDKENNFHCEFVQDNQQSALKILNPNDLESFKHQDNVASCHPTVSDSRYNASYSHSRKLNLAQALPESEQPTFPKHGVQDILNVRDNITSTHWLKLNRSYAEQIRQMNAHVCFNADNKLASATSECYKDKEQTKCGSSDFSNEGNDAQTVVSSGKHLAVLTYILSAAVIVLTIAVMRLHVKIESLEASRDVFNSNYQFEEKQAKFADKQLLGTTNRRETNEKLAALFLTPRLGMTNTEQGTYQNNDDNTGRSDADLQHKKFTKQYNNPHAFRRVITYMSTSTKEAKTESDSITTLGNSSRQEVGQVSDYFMSTDAVRGETLDVGDHPAILSRVVRSASGDQQGGNRRQRHKKMRKEFCKAFKNCSKTQIDSFEGNFYRLISYSQQLIAGECTTHDKWEPDIRACRGNTVFFPKQYSILPFYLETNATAAKKQDKRLVLTDDKGRFHIQKHGHYLIHVNIMVVDPFGTHYLAVYLNNEAVLACPDGGFRCPKTNAESSVKYRICNIMGLFECHQNDTVDIRTMEPNMTVHLEDRQMSHFHFALLK